jgi:hypothetical protein
VSVDFNPQINFVEEQQQGDKLCWIAVAVSVRRHFNIVSTLLQCQLAKALLGLEARCCTQAKGVQRKCDQPGQLEDALAHPLVNHLATGTAANPNPKGNGPMTFAEIKEQIDRDLPVCFYIDWGDEEPGHFSVISGYNESRGKQYVYVNDPMLGSGPRPYSRVVSNYHLDHGAWTFSYRLKA